MNKPHPSGSSMAGLAVLSMLALGAPLRAQTANPTANGAPPAASGQVVQLSPFEVTSQQTRGYAALNSNSITEFNQELDKLPVSADIFDSQFIQDVGADSVESLITEYSAGAGVSLANPGGSAGNLQPNDRNGNTFLSLRGLTAPTMQLNGLMPLNTFFNSGATGTNYTNMFNVERVDVVNGPQALLYGVGGAGGVINLVSKQAYFDQSKASNTFRVDSYGHKYELFDYGVGNDWVAIRLALTDQQIGDRRVNVGGPMKGQYGEIAFKLPHDTVLRINATQTDFNKNIPSTGGSYTAVNATTDVRNGQSLRYLLATNQLQAAANGAPSSGGYIGGGAINWNNLDSLSGNLSNESTRDTFETVSLDTKWTDWLSTRVMAGYRAETDLDMGSGATLLAPGNASNPYPDIYTLQEANLGGLYEPLREKVIRGSIAIHNANLFNGTADSQTLIGADFTRADGDVITYHYVQADANFNPVFTGGTSNNGYTNLSDVYYPLGTGPNAYPMPWGPGQKHISYGGVNYTLLIPNDTNSALVNAGNPLGLSGHGSGDHRIGREINKGVYLANTTTWFNDRLTTLVGVRVADVLEVNQLETGFTTSGDLVPGGNPNKQNNGIASFNFGANYRLLNWLRPYVQVSDSDDPPAVLSANPYGLPPDISHGIGEELGVKIATPDAGISGSLALYHASSKNEQYSFTSSLTNDINPSGLNGRFGAVSNFINADRRTQGVQATIIANPTRTWTMRLSAQYTQAKIDTSAAYPQYYNDQFYTDKAGDVTYADGDIVYVLPTFNSKNAVVTATTPGAIPLTLAKLNNPTDVYYANPQPITSQILASSAAGFVLRQTEPGTGSSPLTHVTGLPISALQINPNPLSPPPGRIVLAEAGDQATGFPTYSAVFTSLYTIPNGPAEGFSFGGTVSAYWRAAAYYFYPQGLSSTNANSPRAVFSLPPLTTFNGIFKYRRKFGRIEFSSQLNINNMFNHYHVVYLPNATGGYTVLPGVTFDAQPRWYQWTNTISF